MFKHVVVVPELFLHKLVAHILNKVLRYDSHKYGALGLLIQLAAVKLRHHLLLVLPVSQNLVQVVCLIGLLRLQDTGLEADDPMGVNILALMYNITVYIKCFCVFTFKNSCMKTSFSITTEICIHL